MPLETVDQIIELAKQLTPMEKLKLIERLAPELEAAIAPQSRRSLRGLLKGCTIGDAEIQESRREMWGNFPRGEF